MIWDLLLTATIETSLGLLAEVGFGDAAQDVHAWLFITDEKKRAAALQIALNKAVAASKNAGIEPLLSHRPFQEEVVRALLDPTVRFDVQTVADYWGAQFPEHVIPLNRFFNALQNSLLDDPIWGPIFERYQNLRFQADVRTALAACQLPASDAVLVNAVSQAAEPYRAELKGNGAIAQGSGAKAVGAGGILVEGSVQQIVSITLNHFISPPAPSATGDISRGYLQFVAAQANLLP